MGKAETERRYRILFGKAEPQKDCDTSFIIDFESKHNIRVSSLFHKCTQCKREQASSSKVFQAGSFR